MVAKDHTNSKFGKLTAIMRLENNASGEVIWYCVCECGNTLNVLARSLTSGNTKSCGCLQKKVVSECSKVHGFYKTRQYSIWAGMKDRCKNEKNPKYNLYGGRGITYDPKWETFQGFWEDMKHGYSDDLTLDRIDSNGNYCVNNCRWTDIVNQNYNTRRQSRNKSGKTGVAFVRGRWRATISKNKKTIHLGYFDSFEEACEARLLAEINYYGYLKNESRGQTDAGTFNKSELKKVEG